MSPSGLNVIRNPVRRFDRFTADLHRLADWLVQCGVTTVAMQSSGVYWIPLYEVMDAGLDLYLVNARHTETPFIPSPRFVWSGPTLRLAVR
ncbi:MAG TPA: hypothetical protein VKE51_40710 [Vicinamibacterales bacterium]|nr:hypothetical protein [Vicinamibacterales bacterium]